MGLVAVHALCFAHAEVRAEVVRYEWAARTYLGCLFVIKNSKLHELDQVNTCHEADYKELAQKTAGLEEAAAEDSVRISALTEQVRALQRQLAFERQRPTGANQRAGVPVDPWRRVTHPPADSSSEESTTSTTASSTTSAAASARIW